MLTFQLLALNTIKKNNLYNHLSGEFDCCVDLTINPNTTIIIEGMYSSSCVLKSLNQIIIFLDAKEEILFERFSKRDSLIRNVSPQLTGERFASINGKSYKAFKLKFTKSSHIRINTDSFDHIKILNFKDNLFSDFL